MSDFVKNIVKLAREYRASEQDARFSQRCDKMVVGVFCHNQIKFAKSIIAYPSTDIKRLVYRIDKSITEDIKQFGVSRGFANSGFVFHHMRYPENNGVIYSNISYDEIKKIRKAVQIYENDNVKTDKFKEVEAEVKDIVLLPAWFHNWCHQHPGQLNNLKSRKDYYNLMAACLKDKRIYENINELQFNDKTVYSALKSIENLALTLDKTYKKEVITELEKLFKKLQDEVKKYLRKNSF